jgi:outer membrane protein assembly factor BamB
VVVLKDGPELEVLSKNDLGGSLVATPAIADGRLYFRTREALICIGL